MNQATYALSPDDLVSAYRAHYWGLWRKPRPWITCLILVMVFSAIMIVANWGQDPGYIAINVAVIAAYWLTFYVLIIAISVLFVLPRKARRIYDQTRMLREGGEAQWSDEGITFASPSGSITYAWPDFFDVKRNSMFVMLYQSEAMFHLLPMRALTAEQAYDIVDKVKRAKFAPQA